MGSGVQTRVYYKGASVVTKGFTINKLQVEDGNKKPAEVEFFPGLNVISGLSNTGKSYIRQCFDYMVGSDNPPNGFEESRGYEKVFLEIYGGDQNYTLERSLKGGDFLLYDDRLQNTKRIIPEGLKAKPEPKPNNISTFLLKLCGVDSYVKLRKNAQNETANLTFRTISHLFIVDENKIIAETSPIYTATGYANTKMKSAFSYLLTGIDDNSIVALPDKEIQKAQIEAKREVYEQIIQDIEKDLESQKDSSSDATNNIQNIKNQIEQISNSIRESHNIIFEYQQDREKAWSGQHEAESRLIVIGELLKRFNLLNRHYLSDLQRLEFINEGEYLFEQLEFVHCPFCNTALDKPSFHKLCLNRENELIKISEGCREEAIKIKTLQKDLESTVNALEFEQKSLREIAAENKKQVSYYDSLLRENLNPKQITEKNLLDNLLADRRLLAEIETKKSKLEELKKAKATLDVPLPKQSRTVKGLDTFALRELGDKIEEVLEAWKFPDVGTVEFNEQKMDILIKGKPRESNGKGVRALLHSAFAVGLMLHCKEKELPHPGWILLDSPLTTFRENNESNLGEEVSGEIQNAFFEHLSTLKSEQIIILENKIPSSNIQSKINFIEFVGHEGHGRKGFFPV
jgi:hypothetical protein